MAVTEIEMFQDQERSNWVRLRTLVILRWFAISGQIVAIWAGSQIIHLHIEVGLAVATIGASVIANLFSTFLYPQNRRLSESEALLMLMFDVLQLGLLLYLTGGLNNPFALLILAPVTIAATVLHLRSTVLVGCVAIIIISLLQLYHIPLIGTDGVLMLPALFRFGFWIALVIGVVFLGVYARQVTTEMHNMSEALLATQMALAREQKLTDLGGVIAAAAHELGTPLATIKLVSSELLTDQADYPALTEDLTLIRDQADRCRDILRSMGRAGKDDLHLRRAPVEAILREAAEPHMNRGKTVVLSVAEECVVKRQPVISRSPEILHGLRNLIQNAVDFADSTVRIEFSWTDKALMVRIADDGPGFPPSVIGRIGEPFMRRRKQSEDRAARPGYEGMGLGLFIAKTLLERSGAKLDFSNGGSLVVNGGAGGAMVVVSWSLDKVEVDSGRFAVPLGENQPIQP